MEVGGYGAADLLSLQFATEEGTGSTIQASQNVCDGAWHFAVGQRTGGITEIWIDGENETSLTGQTDRTITGQINNTANLTIGSKDTQDDDFFNGTIDEFAIHINRSFNEAEIGVLYKSALQKYDTANWSLLINQSGLSTATNYTYQTHSEDIAGNMNSTGNEMYEVLTDTAAPVITVNSPENTTYVDPLGWGEINFTLTDVGTIEYTLYGSDNISLVNESILSHATGQSTGTFTYNWSKQLTTIYSDPVLLFHLDNNSYKGENDTYIYDFSNKKHNGTSTATQVETDGAFGGYTSFAGANTVITVPDHDDLDFGVDENFTISFWFRTTQATAGGEEMIEKQDGGTFYQVRGPESDESNTIRMQIDDSSDPQSTVRSITTNLNDGEWHHAVFVRVYHVNLTLYLDGVYDNTSTDPSDSLAGTTNLLIGDGGSSDYSGDIDDVTIWDRMLGAEEIADLHNLSAQKYYWKLNVTDGTNADETGTYEFTLGTAAGDTCDTCTIDCTENCIVDSELDCSGGFLSFTGSGTIILNENIFNFDNVEISGGCGVECHGGKCII
jgi:hypothetical protein